MSMSGTDAKYVQRAFKDFFSIASKPINVTDEGDETRQYVLRAVAVEEDGTRRAYMVESVEDAVRVVSVDESLSAAA